MEKKKFDKSILQDIKKLYSYDNWHGPLALITDYFIIIIFILLSEYSSWFLPITILVIGSRQRALATILHEASHSALTKNKKFGKILGTYFSGYLIFQSWDSYFKSHVKDHHIKLGSDADPDFNYYKKSGIFKNYSKSSYLWKFFWSKLLFLNIKSSLVYLIKHRLMSASTKIEFIKMLFINFTFISIGSYFFGYKFYFLYWLLPYLTTFQLITWFIELAEHYPMIKSARVNISASRNRFSHPIEHFLTGMHSENYHLIHHLFPAIPFWRLNEAHKVLLEDKEYRALNNDFGGIFFSRNNVDSMWFKIWKNYKSE
ncbi:hypothetical protein F935_03315 [Acinetobacter calcoaceticus ANC 3811]|uniref:Fatty acid desaturase domain-containing protein n=1 Tax=Acinetobacter calcoaceticus ANC 3811 TaxID=1217690 RepID=R8Y0C2_ACICA|nr:guanitoxin biosynthesis L-arginine gamma (S) hydroxylase [Acinetobacter calcoaceticus]EOQ60977.1 hypothetical protein F935_03315 [Acinetobacter calcoaceticus ANC 3811]